MMTEIRFCYTRADGGVSIIVGAPKAQLGKARGRGLTDDEYRAAVRATVPNDAAGVRELRGGDIPADRTFRNAWTDTGGAIAVDLSKARDVARDAIRQARKPILEALDIEFMRANESANAVKIRAVSARKQALRDAPADKRIDAAGTESELKAAMGKIMAEMQG